MWFENLPIIVQVLILLQYNPESVLITPGFLQASMKYFIIVLVALPLSFCPKTVSFLQLN